jgi:hypothetical protein
MRKLLKDAGVEPLGIGKPSRAKSLCSGPGWLIWVVGVALTAGLFVSAAEPEVRLGTDTATWVMDGRGGLQSILAGTNGRDYLAAGQASPLLSVRVNGTVVAPARAVWDADGKRVSLHFPVSGQGVEVTVAAQAKATHVVFEVVDVRPAGVVELVLWGPYPTTIGSIVGEIVGVVRDSEFAVGLQALNAKTLGGSPARESDIVQEFGADDPGLYPNLPQELTQGQGVRGDTAKATAFGSVLQAYSRDRSRDRVIDNWGHDRYWVPAFRDGGVIGSRIALFACPAGRALETIGAIEVAEALPHPMLDGQWAKTARSATSSYLIVDFSETNIDRAIEMTRRAGLKYLYHSSPFATWGHFKLKPELFPNGWDGLRECVEKAGRAGVAVGVHTLSNFITPGDAYVSPVPDERLARIGASELTGDIDAVTREIPVKSHEFFSKESTLNTVKVGGELIRFGRVSEEAPWRLLDCQRGAWGTRSSAHQRDESVARLLDHPYKVFFADADLSREIALNLADLFNRTGTRQISFDGLEGAWSTGLGQYGRVNFTKTWYDALSPEFRGGVINDASNPSHFNWHINTRMNWGEPWYAGFRESQTLYRFKNQVLFERNFMPHMLGWFALRPDTSFEDAEWLLARAAGFDAGFALATSLASTAQLEADPASADTARHFGGVSAILEAIRQWETARLAGAFPAEIKERLRDNSREFHLRTAGEEGWDLSEVTVARFAREAGSTAFSGFEFQNPNPAQSLQWILRSTSKTPVSGITLELNGRTVVELRGQQVPVLGSVKYTGGSEAVIADEHWKEVARVPVNAVSAQVGTGGQKVRMGGALPEGASLKLECRSLGGTTRLRPRF